MLYYIICEIIFPLEDIQFNSINTSGGGLMVQL
jgi:hypothetical protein